MTTQSERATSEKEVEKNYAYFKKMQAKWLDGHLSDYALIHRQKLIAFLKARKTPSTLASEIMGGGSFPSNRCVMPRLIWGTSPMSSFNKASMNFGNSSLP